LTEYKLKAKVEVDEAMNETNFLFGRTQAYMDISSTGKAGRVLKLKDGDMCEITIKKVSK